MSARLLVQRLRKYLPSFPVGLGETVADRINQERISANSALGFSGALATAVAALAVYLLTLCPSVYVEGSGELIGAVHFLGTPHPTGYPLFCLVGRLFSAGLPLESVAQKINVASAFTGALAAGALAAFLRDRGCHSWAGLGAGLGLAFSVTFWSQMVIAEVYGLSMLMMLVVLAIGLKAAERRSVRLLLLTGFSMGLGLTAHLSQVLVWPGLVLLFLWRWPGIWRRWKLLAGTGMAAAGGYSLVLYLPLRNGRGAGFHWGGLNGVGPLWDHLTGALYRTSFFSIPWEGMWLNGSRWFEQAMGEFHPLLVPVILWGVWCAWRRDRHAALMGGGIVLVNLAAALNYHRDPNGLGVFFLPSYVGMAIFLGYGLDGLGRHLGRRGPWLLGMIVPLVIAASNWQRADRSGNWIPHRYGIDILESLPAKAVLMAEGDDVAFILDYLQRVEGMRPDVSLFNRMGRGRDLLGGEEKRLGEREQARLRLKKEGEWVHKGERPIYYLVSRRAPLKGYQFSPEGLVYRLVPEGETRARGEIDMGNARSGKVYRDPWVRKIQANYWFMLGERERLGGRKAESMRAYEKAGEVAFDSRSMRFNVALMLLRGGELELAKKHARAALELDPWQAGPYRLLAHIARRKGRMGEAEYLLKRALFLEGSP